MPDQASRMASQNEGIEGRATVPIAVVIPCYNYGRFLADAIESVFAQTVQPAEIIVVDDGSTDGTREVARTFVPRVRYIYQDHAGLSAARNTGVCAARIPWIAFLDADDRWLPTKIEAQATALAGNPNAAWVFSDAQIVDYNGTCLKKWTFPYADGTREDLLRGLFLGHGIAGSASSVVVHQSCFKHVGLFDPRMKALEDHDLWLRLASRYQLAHAQGVHVQITRHPSSMSRDVRLMRKYMHRVLWKNRGLLGAGSEAWRFWNHAYSGILLTTGKMSLRRGLVAEGTNDLLQSALRDPFGWGRTSLGLLAEWLIGRWPGTGERRS